MSWSLSMLGEPQKVVEALEDFSNNLEGQSKDEFEKVLPGLKAILSQNVGNGMLVRVEANGHAQIVEGITTYGTCNVKIGTEYVILV